MLSSRIDGTQATLGELLAAEAGAVVERSQADLREVANYVMALKYGVERLHKLPLSLRLVRELHETIADQQSQMIVRTSSRPIPSRDSEPLATACEQTVAL